MSNHNPYYRSAPQNDDDFAQQPSHIRYHSAYASTNTHFSHQKPQFSKSDHPQIPPDPKQQKPQKNIFEILFQKYQERKRNNHELSSVSLCKYCNKMTQSFVVKKNSLIAWILCIILLVTTYVCFFLPFLFDVLKNKHIICKHCGKTKFVIKSC